MVLQITKKHKNIDMALIIFILAFFTVWTTYMIYFSEFLDRINSPYIFLIKQFICIFAWIASVFMMIKFYYRSNPIVYLKLNNIRMGLVWALGVMALITLYYIAFCYFRSYTLKFQFSLRAWFGPILLIGFAEEIVFRGFIFQKLMERMNFISANIIAAFLYLILHFPRWFLDHRFSNLYIIDTIVFTLAFALAQAYILKKSQSLWACILIHSFNNLMAWALRFAG